ncbi:MAG TPA: class I SAM-dependent methyltransferase [Methanofastidiosum sp.]|jgi:ubiquinone/menaquinone biosynthesis C-methylase UbiE|nr:class I SAM-dependent methyltransferase [Methanofastidiosum sp.]HNZ60071.1 class I SAM-dependent methyltransferase [Methanofastidiosum sp.]HOE93250.1 class I SAM-dependent methyltransferase [Methanofastidiosum sp.]HOR88071.1 class I SAM-dependent methyltransferase [Methanofastidiosum sp.]HOT84795.1 class I SAM-dependent methyltransferase [Methanofastidiosum sp.]
MAHKFNVKEMHKLDSFERRKILPPEEILIKAGLKIKDIFLDIGCGIGYFSIPASRIIGIEGKVFALDTSSEMLEELKRRIYKKNIKNIIPIFSEPYRFPLDSNVGTFALISNVLHEVEDKISFLEETNRVLIRCGTLCIVEWQKKETERGPPLEDRINESEIKNLLEKTNYKLTNIHLIGDFFSLYISKKLVK